MGALDNPRHERFVQELARGKTADEAYVIAGYVENRKNASRLKTREDIGARLSEILDRAAARVEVSIAGITERLMGIAAIAERTGVDIDLETGVVTKSSPKHLSVARAALMDTAKLNGLIIEKTEHSGTLTLEQLVASSFEPLPAIGSG